MIDYSSNFSSSTSLSCTSLCPTIRRTISLNHSQIPKIHKAVSCFTSHCLMGFQLTRPTKFSSSKIKEQYSSSSIFGVSRGLFGSVGASLRRCLFRILSVGPIPNHIAFIMDGNRRYAKKHHLETRAGHRAGYLALMSILKYCCELKVKYVTIYALSIDNFKRKPDEVQNLMDLMLEKIEGLLKEKSNISEYGIRVYFIGDLRLLNEPVRIAAETLMRATAKNSKCVLLICVAYTSSNEIVHAVEESCADKIKAFEAFDSATTREDVIGRFQDDKKISAQNGHVAIKPSATNYTNGEGIRMKHGTVEQWGQGSRNGRSEADALKVSRTANGANAVKTSEKMQGKHSIIKVVDIEKNMYMSVAPDPDLLIRSSGETRLSNFLLWQSSICPLYSPKALWPENGLWQLVWGILTYQRNYSYLEKRKKQS